MQRQQQKPPHKAAYCVPLLAALCCVVFLGCSTQKAKWGNVAYHNTTAHYNVWWNGNESMKEGVAKLEKAVPDDFTRILPVYKLGSKTQSMSIYPEMDRAIEKGLKGIKKHSILLHGEEHVPYVRKCSLLTAYASFYKQDYVSADNTCRMIASQYAGTAEADEAQVLLARCLTADRQYLEAENALDQLVVALGRGDFPSKLRPQLYMAMVESLLPQEKYKKAVQFAKLAIDAGPTRGQKARLYFILGQIYQKLEKRPTAAKYYGLSLNKTQEYVMEFNARLNLASCADLEHADLPKLERSLDKMLADKKNEEYLDQIYYAKGEMYLGVKDAKKACDNFAKSVSVSTNNTAQKAKSAIRLADVQYDLYENYDAAQRYYDTAMTVITIDYPRYKEVKARHDVLTSLVAYTRLIQRNDSLLVVADMDEDERKSLIEQKIKEVEAAEEEARKQEVLKQYAQDAKAQQNTLQGDWYFYNPNSVQQGKQTFSQRWGQRLLEDYWFLSKKNILSMGGLVAGSPADDTADTDADSTYADSALAVAAMPGGNPDDPHSVAYYLKDLPTTTAQRDSMHSDMAVALLNAGYIYYDGVKNIARAVECYQRMANEYPERDEVVQAFFMLYRIYSKQGNTPSANYYKNMVLMGFPDSDFANLIRDEGYYKELVQRSQIINEEYRTLYDTYRRGRYRQVVAQSQALARQYPDNPALERFRFWEALAYVRLDSTAQAVAILETLAAGDAATDSIVPIAQQQLAYLQDGGHAEGSGSDDETITDADEERASNNEAAALKPAETVVSDEEQLSQEAQMYRYKPQLQHYVIVIVNDKKIRATDLQYKIADFNAQYYSNKGYRVNPLMFTDSTQMLTIHRFVDAEEAVNYWLHLQQDSSPLSKLNAADYVLFPISTQNYTTFYNRKKIDAYREFFEKYYTILE